MPRARQQNAATEQASETPPADMSSQPVNSRKTGIGRSTPKALPRLVIKRPQGAAATTQGLNTHRLRMVLVTYMYSSLLREAILAFSGKSDLRCRAGACVVNAPKTCKASTIKR